jgi:hypothetical protein
MTTNEPRYLTMDELINPPAATTTSAPAGPPSRVDRYEARLTPLHIRLQAALEKIPADIRSKGLHMSTIWPLCSGVQRIKPPAWKVGEALRLLGWQRHRIYSDGTEPSGTYWFPPGMPMTSAKAALRQRKAAK